MKDETFPSQQNAKELKAWNIFKQVCENLLEYHKEDNNAELVKIDELLARNWASSLNIHFLDSHLNLFSGKLGCCM